MRSLMKTKNEMPVVAGAALTASANSTICCL